MAAKKLRQHNQEQEFYVTKLISTTFRDLIPSTVKSIIFTDKVVMPSSATLINVNEDDGIITWLDGTTMYVSTEKNGVKVKANRNSNNMFYLCSNLATLDLSNFDTSNVIDMSSMFYGCNNLTKLDVSNFDTSNVEDMNSMFCFCNISALTVLDLSKWDTSKVTYYMNEMFCFCSKLTTLDVSKWGY